jgi:hypothetical protein
MATAGQQIDELHQQLMTARQRIAELEAELKPFREFKAAASQMQPLPIQSAGGAGVTWDAPLIKEYVDQIDFNADAIIMYQDGYSIHSWRIIEREYMYAVMWQRPAQSEVEE